MDSILPLIGRDQGLFDADVECREPELTEIVASSRFLVLGGAGTIGQAVAKELFKRHPRKLHVIDISENNLVELVRDIRSAFGYIEGDFRTFALDIGAIEYDAFIAADGQYDYIFNLSALKHVRSEEDPFTLMRMIDVNIFNTEKSVKQAVAMKAAKYFCVSTDKAANPVNMMGGSKRIMELFLMRRSAEIDISTARFANVAFSDGSLPYGFTQRMKKRQPIVAPRDVKRYFLTPEESGQLCLMSCIFGENRDIFFPKLMDSTHLLSLDELAMNFLRQRGYEPYLCESEDQARMLAPGLIDKGQWACFFADSDTTGEKDVEVFFTESEVLNMERFDNIGIIKGGNKFDENLLSSFDYEIRAMKARGTWDKTQIVDLFSEIIPDFSHVETGKYLDSKM